MKNDFRKFCKSISPLFNQPGIENVFLSYLNADPVKGPKEFLATFNIAKKHFKFTDSNAGAIQEILFHMERFEKDDSSMINKETIFALHDEPDDAPDMVSAYSHFGYLEMGCGFCVPLTMPQSRKEIIESLGTKERCYICLHRQFVHLINAIFIEDHMGSGLNTLIELFNKGYSSIQRRVNFAGALEGYQFGIYWKWSLRRDVKRINDILMDLASVSLCEFCISSDMRKIKRCPYCDNFYIAKDLKRQRCYSDQCRKEYERLKKKKQRDLQPEIYS